LLLFFKKEVLSLALSFGVRRRRPTPHRASPPERASGILGAAVQGPDGKDLGRIIDVLVDDTGKPRAAVIGACLR
jgi:hypothetical protein